MACVIQQKDARQWFAELSVDLEKVALCAVSLIMSAFCGIIERWALIIILSLVYLLHFYSELDILQTASSALKCLTDPLFHAGLTLHFFDTVA